MSNIITLKSVHKITKMYIQPTRSKKTGRYYSEHVKPVNAKGEMTGLSRKEIDSGEYFVREDEIIEVYDGVEFDLDDQIDSRRWNAIKDSEYIAKDRDAKNSDGSYVIDGKNSVRGDHTYVTGSHGRAEFYIEKVGAATKQRNSKRKLIRNASNYIFDDSLEGLAQKTRILGTSMKGLPQDDLIDYLLEISEKNPQKIIDLYTGIRPTLHLLLLDCLDNNIITHENNLYSFGDTILSTTVDGVISWFQDPKNKKLKSVMEQQCNPEMFKTINPEV